MRVGKWVQLYNNWIPIPRRLAMAFGLTEGSALHLVPLIDQEEEHKYGFDIMVSPVPPASWRSVCRLSVRLLDVPKALAVATEFLSTQRINILFSESASTIDRRAHWDAICDLRYMPAFAAIAGLSKDAFPPRMKDLLKTLSRDLEGFMRPDRKAFPDKKNLRHGEFSPLTGLNNATFIWDASAIEPPCTYTAGGIRISDELASRVMDECPREPRSLPEYAMITGNTEQSYLRVLFLRHAQSLFRVVIDVETKNFASGGTGILHQVLGQLPDPINLLRTSSKFMDGEDAVRRGWIEIIAHWKERLGRRTPQYIKALIEKQIPEIRLRDLDGNVHEGAIKVTFDGPETIYPRVFVSYSTQSDPAKLAYLIGRLSENHFHPVLGTDRQERRGALGRKKAWTAPADVVSNSFEGIEGCVALVSLQLEHPDFRVIGNDGHVRKILPPWAVAEEVWAWAREIEIWRLRDESVELPRYQKNQQECPFRTDDTGESFVGAVDKLLDELNKFRKSPAFITASRMAREAQRKKAENYSPDDY
ncbi:MAG TPA: hypothetical protein VJ276_09080 [Thermoanaerobaculia bacterium]|nr:hypothetical protein [Thermoanaerobaculia bacterium]